MNTITLNPLPQPITTSVDIIGCTSYTIRALNLAAVTTGSVTINNVTYSDDVRAMLDILIALGINLEEHPSSVIVHGHIQDVRPNDYTLNVNISGRTARTILSTLCLVPGTKTLICEHGFKRRPVLDLVDGLTQLGAHIEYLEEPGYLPVKITSNTLSGTTVSMPGNVSSQYFSSLMMIAPLLSETLEIHVQGDQASKPFIDVTIQSMNAFGVEVKNNSYQTYTIPANQRYAATGYTVEADAIAASYFWGLAALTGSTITVNNLPPTSKQGDIKFADYLAQMGCSKSTTDDSITITGSSNQQLRSITLNANSTPDSVQTLAVIAAFAQGVTHITGIEHLSIKETDRIKAPATELKKLGIKVETTADSLTIHGNPQLRTSLTQPSDPIATYGDHRMAMAFSLIGSLMPITIQDPHVVNKSFPTYWQKLAELGINSKLNS